MKNLAQFFQDDGTGCFSATRLAFLVWIFGALIIWGTGSFHDKKMQEVPSSVTALIGILMTGKVIQKFSETSGPALTSDQSKNGNASLKSNSLAGNGADTELKALKL